MLYACLTCCSTCQGRDHLLCSENTANKITIRFTIKNDQNTVHHPPTYKKEWICFVRGMSRAYTKEFQRKNTVVGEKFFFISWCLWSVLASLKNYLELLNENTFWKMGQTAQGHIQRPLLHRCLRCAYLRKCEKNSETKQCYFQSNYCIMRLASLCRLIIRDRSYHRANVVKESRTIEIEALWRLHYFLSHIYTITSLE